MTFGPKDTGGARITDVDEFKKVLDLFQSRGYNEVDTARVYTDNQQEAFTKEAGWKERGLTLATKIRYPNEPGSNTYDKVLESCETSLKELGTDHVDLLYLHAAVGLRVTLYLLHRDEECCLFSAIIQTDPSIGPRHSLRRDPFGH